MDFSKIVPFMGCRCCPQESQGIRRSGFRAMELPVPVADGAMGMVSVRRMALPPEPIQAGRIVGEAPPELD